MNDSLTREQNPLSKDVVDRAGIALTNTLAAPNIASLN